MRSDFFLLIKLEKVKNFKPDVMIVGSDWKGKSVIGSYYASELRFFERIGDYATTKTIENIINRR